jgi:poly(3-hydroxybutyrate) depolymerase
MSRLLLLLLLCYALFGLTNPAAAETLVIRSNMQLGPDSLPQDKVPQGQLLGPMEFHSRIFTGTVRQYWLFVPAQYDKVKPASLLVFQDGQRATNPQGSLRVPQVMANLIEKGDMPVTIGLFITPGNRSAHYPTNLGMSNPDHRAEEYDAMNDNYVRMLIDELIPLVSKDYTISSDPEQHAIGGTSSGAIAAFTAAWHRPDYFRKVFSSIGSYVSIGFRPNETPIKLGGQDYPALIRREAIRPMKVFFHDGSSDLSNEWGNWFLANQQMVSALQYANKFADEKQIQGPRYQFTSVWTDGEHSDAHGGALLPDALRWLWTQE